MKLDKFQRDLKASYNAGLETVDLKVEDIIKHITNEWNVETSKLTLPELQILSSTVVDAETKALHDEVESLLAKKEQIERQIEKKSHDLQELKYNIFDAIETQIGEDNSEVISRLHQIKLQTVDIYDLLSEIVESAIITAIEKDPEIEETIEEVIKHITYEAIDEGSLSTLRIRKILATILHSAIEIAEATPVKAHEILYPTIKGMRVGLTHSITRFNQQLAFIPDEAKHILIEDFDTIVEDLHHIDSLFEKVVTTQSYEASSTIRDTITTINSEMKYDLDELLRISKDTASVMKERFSHFAHEAVRKADKALHSPKAIEAKRMGKQALGVAKNAIDTALKTAKDAIDKK